MRVERSERPPQRSHDSLDASGRAARSSATTRDRVDAGDHEPWGSPGSSVSTSTPVGGDEEAVLELRRARAVARRRGPPVGPDAAELPRALVDHRLDREREPGREHEIGRRVVVVQHRGRGVELLTDAVADERAHDAEARRFRVGLDRAADLVEARAGPHLVDALPQRFLRDLHEPAALVVDVADEEGRVAVAVHAVQVDRDVAVDDVAVEERAVVGDAVADHLVDRRAQRLREALVVQRARVAAARDARLVADAVELVGRHADLHRVGELEQDLAPGAARGAHAVGELVGRDRGQERRRVGRVRRARDRGGDRAVGREAARRGPAPGDPRGPGAPTRPGAGPASPSPGACPSPTSLPRRSRRLRPSGRLSPAVIDHGGRRGGEVVAHHLPGRPRARRPRRARRASPRARRRARGSPMTNGACRIRSRGWPFSSL